MANIKISQLSQANSVSTTDLLVMSVNSGGSYISQTITSQDLHRDIISDSITSSAIYLSKTAISSGDSPYAVTDSDYTLYCNSAGGAITVDLPAATGSGRFLIIKKIDSSNYSITVDGNASEVIDGETTQIITDQWTSIIIQDAGTGTWYIH